MLIAETARCMELIHRMNQELSRGSLMLTQTGSMSQEKQSIHPFVSMIQKYEVVVGRNLIALGLGNTQAGKVEIDGIEELINTLK